MQSSIDPDMLWLFRNHPPADIRFYPKMGILLFATNDRHIECASTHELGEWKAIHMKQDTGMEFHLQDNKHFTFDI